MRRDKISKKRLWCEFDTVNTGFAYLFFQKKPFEFEILDTFADFVDCRLISADLHTISANRSAISDHAAAQTLKEKISKIWRAE